MLVTCKRARNGRFLRAEAGNVSVEYAVWLPILVSVGLMINDASSALMTQASMWRTASDVARGVATGRLSMSEAQAGNPGSGVSMQITPAGSHVSVRMSKSFAQIGTGIVLAPLGVMEIQLLHLVESNVSLGT